MTSAAVERRTGNLPAEVTRFIGRRAEIVEIKGLLERSRLVTLHGTGGVGKTRLALRVAADLRRSFADGAWLVELSALREPELVPRAVAEVLLPHDQSAGDPVDMLADHLADRHVLLVLDTCEHLLDACAMLAEVLLRAAPRLRVLTTSRQPLQVIGEHTLVVPPLPVPGGSGGGEGDSDSVALFTDRAEAIAPGFTLTPGNRPAVARLCHRLDGIPLAIELAAVRLRAMSIEQLVARLDDRFRLLGSSRTRHDRHQTLRAAIAWSHDLCAADEQGLWARLSAFPGDFGLEAAEQVCSDGDLPAGELFDTLGRLVDKSIVLCDHRTGRYRMLDTIREYGAERLAETGLLDGLRRRHRAYYLDLAGRAADGRLGERQIALLSGLRGEHHNLRVALDHLLGSPAERSAALRTVAGLRHYWVSMGLLSEGRRWFARALDGSAEASADRAWALSSAAALASVQGDIADAESLLAAAGPIAAASDDAALHAHLHQVDGLVAFCDGDLERALRLLERARTAYRAAGHGDSYALACSPHLASVHCLRGDFERALAECETGIADCEAHGELWSRSYTLYVRGLSRCMLGDVAGALRDAYESLRLKNALGDDLGIAMALDLVAACLVNQSGAGQNGGGHGGADRSGGDRSGARQGGADQSRTDQGEADQSGADQSRTDRRGADRRGADQNGADRSGGGQGGGGQGGPERAAVLFGATERLWAELRAPMMTPEYVALRELNMAAARAALDGPAYEAARRRGGDLTIREAIAVAHDEPGAAVPADPADDPLTPRERQIAGLVRDGLANREIADRLVISKRTVDSHVEHILAKLGFTSRTQIAAWLHPRNAEPGQ